jgi:AraC-like DNA-binding protein
MASISVPGPGAVLYVPDVAGAGERVRAWRPPVAGVSEVLHAHFTEHAYPAHVHGDWTLLLVDSGGVDYTLDGERRQAVTRRLTVLPPYVSHDGRSAAPGGFDKRVLYVDQRWLPDELVGAAVRAPSLADDELVQAVSVLHACLDDPLEAEARLAMVAERIALHLSSREPRRRDRDPGLARLVRTRLDDDEPTLEELARELGTHPSHLVRTFRREYGLPPHRYVVGRRLDRARRMLLDGIPIADVAAATGFHDQSHLTRHFRALLGTTPGAFRGASRGDGKMVA